MFNLPLLMGASAGASGANSPQTNIVNIVMIVAVFAVFWFLIIRPQRKRQKEEQRMRESVRKGDKITSIGGIRGTVKNVTEKYIIVEVDNKGNTLELLKSAGGSVESDDSSKKKASKDESDESSEKK